MLGIIPQNNALVLHTGDKRYKDSEHLQMKS